MTTIPLNQLSPAKANVRKTGAHDGIEELAASIAAHGLLTSLAVKKSARGKFTVVAGQRRYHALKLLARRDQVPADLPVLCQLVDADADVTELGLAENVVRLAMHPADQFEAFAALITKGASIADIAARFGVAEATVVRRLKLGRVSPAILEAYRAGTLSLEQVQAFTVSDDHTAQERIFAEGAHRCSPHAIRRALTEGEIPATDKRVRFIGFDAYEAAGGAVRRDLFDDRNAGYVLDAALLDSLVQGKLEALCEPLRAEGWGWVEAHPDFSYADRALFAARQPEEVPLPEEEAEEFDRLCAEHDELSDEQFNEDGDDDPAVTARLTELDDRLGALQARRRVWTDEAKAMSGIIVSLSHDGEVEAQYGLIRSKEAQGRNAAGDDGGKDAETQGEADSPAPSLPATLVADLTAQRTAALRAILAQQRDVALAAVTHVLAASPGLSAFDDERERWVERLPRDAGSLWAWCITQTQDTLLALLAVSAAHSLDAVRDKGTRVNAPRLVHADALANALGFDMRDWFTPTAANYFGKVNRGFIVEALTEAGRPARTRTWSKLKKAELAALAERELQGTGWLPQPLRTPAGTAQAEDAQDGSHAAAAA